MPDLRDRNTMKSVILVQYGISEPLTYVAPYRGLIWNKKMFMSEDDKNASFWNLSFNAEFDDISLYPLLISTISYKGNQLSKLNNLDDLFRPDVTESYYFDQPNQILYIKNFDNKPLWQTPGIAFGITKGASTAADVMTNDRPFNMAFGGVDHPAVLIESSISDARTFEGWGSTKMLFDAYSFSLINSNGAKDNIRDTVISQPCTMLMAEVDVEKEIMIDDFKVINYGKISDVSYPDIDTIRFEVEDTKKSLDLTIPTETYKEGFGGLVSDDPLIGENYPIGFGITGGVPLQRLSETQRTFHYGWASPEDPIELFTSIFKLVDNVKVNVPSSQDLTTGIITLDNSDDIDAKLYANALALDIGDNSDAISVFLWVLNRYKRLAYIESNFDIEQFEKVRENRNTSIWTYIPVGGITLAEFVDQLMSSINCVIYMKGSVISIEELTNDKPVVPIDIEDLIAPPAIIYNGGMVYSSIKGTTDKSWGIDQDVITFSDKYRESVFNRYSIDRTFEFDTLAISFTELADYIEERYKWVSIVRPTLELQFGTRMDIDYLDKVSFHYEYQGRELMTPAIFLVTAISKTRKTATLTFIEEA